jgi:hypothetical protein
MPTRIMQYWCQKAYTMHFILRDWHKKKSLRISEGPSCKKLYTSNYFAFLASLAGAVVGAAAGVAVAAAGVAVSAAGVTTVASGVAVVAAGVAVSVVASEPPHAANAAIAKIANTFFIFKFLVWLKLWKRRYQ